MKILLKYCGINIHVQVVNNVGKTLQNLLVKPYYFQIIITAVIKTT